MEVDIQNQVQEYKLILDGFPDLVESLIEFFDEEAPNEIVKYEDLGAIEPAYCKE
jgi:hypothetical protein